MADLNLSAGSAAVQTLKNSQKLGKEFGSVITDQQADMERSVQEQHRKRLQEKANEARRQHMFEFRAVEKYEYDKAHEQEIEKLKTEITNKHGKKAWSEIESIKQTIKAEDAQEKKYVDHDRQKMNDLFFWCLGAAALVTYFFKLYKL